MPHPLSSFANNFNLPCCVACCPGVSVRPEKKNVLTDTIVFLQLFLFQLLRGIAYCHKRRVLHRFVHKFGVWAHSATVPVDLRFFQTRSRSLSRRLFICIAVQGCQFGVFEGKFWNSGFLTPFAFFGNQKMPDKIWLFSVGKAWFWQNIVWFAYSLQIREGTIQGFSGPDRP